VKSYLFYFILFYDVDNVVYSIQRFKNVLKKMTIVLPRCSVLLSLTVVFEFERRSNGTQLAACLQAATSVLNFFGN